MHHGKRASLLAIALIAAIASSASAQTMAYRFKEGDNLHYVLEQKMSSVMGVAGLGVEIKVKVNTTMSMAWQIAKVDAQGNAQIKVKVVHSKMSMESDGLGTVEVDSNDKALPNDLAGRTLGMTNKAFATMEMTATMMPSGELKDIKLSEDTVKAMKSIPGADKGGDITSPDNFKDMISGIVFPAGDIAKGKTWTSSYETKTGFDKANTEKTYTADGSVERDGVTLEKISESSKIKVVSAANAIVKTKSAKSSGYTLFDNKAGRIVESSVVQNKVGTVTVMGIGLDKVSEETTTLKLQKGPAVGVGVKSIASIKFAEDDFVDKVVFTEPLETLAGAARSFTVERSLERSVSLQTEKAPAGAADEIKALIETSLGEKIGNRITVKESITLDGKELTKVNVQWIERSRRGVAVHSDGTMIPFQVKTGLRIKLEKAK